jgi:hypothetical protein
MKNLIKNIFLNKIIFNIIISFVLGLLFIYGLAGITVARIDGNYTQDIITSLISFSLFILVEIISFKKQHLGVRIVSIILSLYIVSQYYFIIERLLAQ